MKENLVSRTNFAKMAGVAASTVTRLCDTILHEAKNGKYIDISHPAAVKYLDKKTREPTQMEKLGFDERYEEITAHFANWPKVTVVSVQRQFGISRDRAKSIVEAWKATSGKKPPPAPTGDKELQQELTVNSKAAKPEKPQIVVPRANEDEIIEVPDDIASFLNFTLEELIIKFGTSTRFLDWLNATQKIEQVNEKRLKNAQTRGTLISRDLVKKGVIDQFNSAHLRLLKDGAKTIAAGVISKHASGATQSEIEEYITDMLGSFIRPVKSKIERVLKDA